MMTRTRSYYLGEGFDSRVSRAESSLKEFPEMKKEWFEKLIFILKNKKYARIMISDKLVDVADFTCTYTFASYFDICNIGIRCLGLENSKIFINYQFEPIEIDKCEHSFREVINNIYWGYDDDISKIS